MTFEVVRGEAILKLGFLLVDMTRLTWSMQVFP